MGVYLLIYLFNVLLSICEFINKKPILLKISFVVLALFLGLSYTNGIDWTVYQMDYIYRTDPVRVFEYGYDISVSIFKAMGFNFEFFKFTILTIDLYIIYVFLKKYSPYPLFSIIVLFQTFLLGNFFEPAIRQLQAMVIFLFAFKYLVEDKKMKYFLCCGFGLLFHTSSIILFPLYFIRKRQIKLRQLFVLIIIVYTFSNLASNIILFIVNKSSLLNDYTYYFDKIYFEGSNFDLLLIIKVIVYFIPIYLLKNFGSKSKENIVLFNFSIIFFMTFMLQNQIMIFYRFNHYFIIIYVAFIANLFVVVNKKIIKTIIFAFFVSLHCFSLVRGIQYYKDKDPMKYYPYTNYIIELVKGTNYKSPEEKIYYRLENRRIYK
ncbi:EpsG family protein [Clostridium sp.]|uniref:EpsG family protein n=1 Tax=Clostridium sp. TaxID=1506 RepID=UPI003D6C8BF9